MKKIKIDLENCYGIKKLDCEFKFNSSNVISIYASNGIMKTSFAKTLNVSKGEPKDFTNEIIRSKYAIYDDNDNKLEREKFLVIESFDEKYGDDGISLLTASQDLKLKHENLINEINELKERFYTELSKNINKKPANVEKELFNVFNVNSLNDLVNILSKQNVISNFSNLNGFIYKNIFNEKVKKFFKKDENINMLNDYIDNYKKIIDKSKIFNSKFGFQEAIKTSEGIDSGFFSAGHILKLKSKRNRIKNAKQLNMLLKKEIEKIFKNETLTNIYTKIETNLGGEDELKIFRDFLNENKFLLQHIKDFDDFNKNILKYLIENSKSGIFFIQRYLEIFDELEHISKEVKKDLTNWHEVKNNFNDKFIVPFDLDIQEVKNNIFEMPISSVVFKFKNSNMNTQYETTKDILFEKILSQGEKRALYILNVMFEIKKNINENKINILVFDDIADSFDYKNKYAIIEYIKELSENSNIKIIVLTHNFDFFRNFNSRLSLPRCNNLLANKTSELIELSPAKYQGDVFQKLIIPELKNLLNIDNLSNNQKNILISAIPFVRQLAGYCNNMEAEDALTNFLHFKNNTDELIMEELMPHFRKILNIEIDNNKEWHKIKYIEMLKDVCNENCSINETLVNIEEKVSLSIGIRVFSEKYMISELTNYDIAIDLITSNQTFTIYDLFQKEFKNKIWFSEKIKKFKKVNLITPENIHLNSFMYEPIIDISPNHLQNLYNIIKGY